MKTREKIQVVLERSTGTFDNIRSNLLTYRKSESTMKKYGFKAIPIRKLIPTLLALSLASVACTQSGNKELEGSFSGSDGSNVLPNQVDWTISLAGDGLISGIWSSKGEITKGQLSGKLGAFKNELILYVQSGNCTGQFHGNFTFEKGELKGTLKDNANCNDHVYNFDLKKVH
jgi:hypothetical protein